MGTGMPDRRVVISVRVAHAVAAAALAIGVAASAAASDDADPGSAEAFLRGLYAPYLAGSTTVAPTDKAAPTIFDGHLTALIRKDQRNAKGEVGALDWDPICDCQDFERLTALSIKVRPAGPARAVATVDFMNGTTPASLTYTLVAGRSGWRVADIGSKDVPSLVDLLAKANAAR